MTILGQSKVYTLAHHVPVSAMIRFSSDLIIMVDSDHHIIDVNDRFIQVAGVQRDALIGQRIEEIGSDLLAESAVSTHTQRSG
ncbi:MAG: PAS domain-containing protein [Bacillus subtilis]|nr:PAS domain-containing protein [Bacillus subtilis]